MKTIPDNIDFNAYLERIPEASYIKPASEFRNQVVDYLHGDGSEEGLQLPWDKVHGRFKFRPGEVTLWLGINGHGKSLMLGQAMLEAMRYDEKSLIASFEMPPHITMARMCRQAIAVGSPSIPYIDAFHESTDDLMWLYSQTDTVKHDRVIAVGKYAHVELGIRHYVIDSLVKCGINTDDYNLQKTFVDQLTALARDTGMHIHLVHHARKGVNEDYSPGKMDAKGAGEITDLVHNVLIVWRNKRRERELAENPESSEADDPGATLICDKQRNGDWEGTIALWFDDATTQYIGSRNGRPRQYVGDVQ